MTIEEIIHLIYCADATKDRNLLEKAKEEIDKLDKELEGLYDFYNYELTKI